MTSETILYHELYNTLTPRTPFSKGIVVASDLSQEKFLPWWWDNYKAFNDFPVTFVDLGLSREMKQWCKEKGNYVHLPISGLFVSEQEEMDPAVVKQFERESGKYLWGCRSAWFRKPLACLQSPYESSIWMDIDCEIRGSIESLFSFCTHPSGMSLAQEYGIHSPPLFNSGVIAFAQNTSLLRLWALKSLKEHTKYPGDQDVLNAIFHEQKISPGLLPPYYNWSRFKEENPESIIVHWHGPHGKRIIEHQMQRKHSIL